MPHIPTDSLSLHKVWAARLKWWDAPSLKVVFKVLACSLALLQPFHQCVKTCCVAKVTALCVHVSIILDEGDEGETQCLNCKQSVYMRH